MLAVDMLDWVDRAATVLVGKLSGGTVAVLDEESCMDRRCLLLPQWTGLIELRRCWLES